MNKTALRPSHILAAAVSIALYTSVAVAADATGLEEVVVTGTRKVGQLLTDTMSPVDVISGAALTDQPSFNLTDSLTRISPSLNTQRFPIADGTALVRPVSLRGLSPDQTLVLMNSVRRHRSALVNLQIDPLGTVNQGAQAVDWGAFPAFAIKKVEILRDGAAAQYGSDAIAGVVNIMLKDSTDGLSFQTIYGDTYEGDGDEFTASANYGMPLTEKGFLNATLEYSTSNKTWRGVPRPDSVQIGELVGKDLVPLQGFGQRWGDPNVETWKGAVNMSASINDNTEAYGFATYTANTTISDFFYRRPVLTNPADQVGLVARPTLQLADAHGYALMAPQTLIDSIVAQGLNPDNYLTNCADLPLGDVSPGCSAPVPGDSEYVLRNPIWSNFPGGYNPRFGADMTDYSLVGGVRGEINPHLTWDLAARYGNDEIDYKIEGTINPSLGDLSPLNFHPGKLTQEETGVNLDFVKTFEGSPLNLAFGAEWRDETYKIAAGDPLSYSAGPTAAFFGVGSDGFQGSPKEAAGNWDSNSWAAYVDAETDVTDKFSVGGAVRYEDYQEYGNTTNWKVSGRYAFTDQFAFRATANTGFRSPTPGQVNTLNVTTTANSQGDLVPLGTFPTDSLVASTLGAKSVDPEKSISYTAGFVWDATGETSFTLDYYYIKVNDRIALLNHTVTPEDVAALVAAGVPYALQLDGSTVGWFANSFESSVNGVDAAATTHFNVGSGDLALDLRYNYNSVDVSNIKSNTIDSVRAYDIENQIPKNRAVLTFDYTQGDAFEALMRVNYYGSWSTQDGQLQAFDPPETYHYGSLVPVDLEASYRFMDDYKIAVGGQNIFDTYPDREKNFVTQSLGGKYALTSPIGFNGGLWYLRFEAKFGM